MIGMKPKDVIKLDEVPLVNREAPKGPRSMEVYSEENKLPENGLYWYLLQPGEEHDDQRRRAMDS